MSSSISTSGHFTKQNALYFSVWCLALCLLWLVKEQPDVHPEGLLAQLLHLPSKMW